MLQKIKPALLFLSVLALGWGNPVLAQEQDLAPLQQKAQLGDAAAQLQLAERYSAGQGIPQNFAAASRWFRAAAEQGNTTAQNRLGKYLQSGLGGARDDAAAVKWLIEAARDGTPQHLVDLAKMYENGFGLAQDYTKTAELYRRAADAGHEDAAVSLGVLYQNGTGVTQDYAKAHALYLGPAQAGNARAQNNLGLLYTRGNGVVQDYKQAAKWFAKAAQNGLATAMTNLGVMYENGFGVAQSDAKAADLYRQGGQGSAQGNPLDSVGFIPDARLNIPAYGRATLNALQTEAKQGDPIAQFALAYLLVTGPDARSNYPVAAHWFKMAAQAGLPAAMANLGLLYYRGYGVPQDFVTGYMWLALASARNPQGFAPLRDGLALEMTAGQINEAQALAAQQWQK